MLHVWQGSKYANVRSHFGSFLSAAYGFVFICLPVFEHFIWAFCLRQLMQRSKERGINCHYHFADFKSVFDTIWRKQLSKMMRSISICYKIVSIIENMYEKVTCAVVVDGLLIERFCVSVRVRQGCLLSPIFFSHFSWLCHRWTEMRAGTCNTWLWIETARHAHDTTLTAAVFEKLQLATDQLQEASKKYRMKINTDKCKLISNSPISISIENKNIKIVEEFKFLGSVVSKSSRDSKRRKAIANSAYGRLRKSVWSCRDIPTKLKLRLYNALIQPIAIYGNETWFLTQLDNQKIWSVWKQLSSCYTEH